MDSIIIDVLRNNVLKELTIHDQINLTTSCKYLYQCYSIVMQNVVNRLKSLLNEMDKTIIEFVQERAVIAGGSVVYSLNEFVPRQTVKDIDIYINNEETFNEIFNYIRARSKNVNITTTSSVNYNGTKSNIENSISIVNIYSYNEVVSFQLILFKYETPFDIIRTFDFDYVQSAFYKNQVYLTNLCRQAHRTQQVKYGAHIPYSARLTKAVNKGFKSIIIGSEKYVDEIPLDNKHNLTYFSPKPNISLYSLDTIVVTELRKSKPTQLPDGVFMGNRYDPHNVDIIYQLGETKLKSKYVSLEIDVIHYYTNGIYIKPLQLGQFTINVCQCLNENIQNVPKGKYIVKALFRITKDPVTQLNSLRLKILDIFEYNNSFPVKFSHNLTVII